MIEGGRRSGRTTRMLEAAIASPHEQVIVIGHDERFTRILYDMTLGLLQAGQYVYGQSIPSRKEIMRSDGRFIRFFSGLDPYRLRGLRGDVYIDHAVDEHLTHRQYYDLMLAVDGVRR